MKAIIFISLIILASCGTIEERRRADYYNNSPSGFTEVISSRKLRKIKPVQLVNYLKKNCCDAIMVEPTTIDFWTVEDINALAPMLGDEAFTSPVASTAGTVNCRGARYMSTVDREVQHLILAFKEKKYPLAQCSTLDLVIKTK